MKMSFTWYRVRRTPHETGHANCNHIAHDTSLTHVNTYLGRGSGGGGGTLWGNLGGGGEGERLVGEDTKPVTAPGVEGLRFVMEEREWQLFCWSDP